MTASLERPAPVITADLDDVRIDLFLDLPADHGLSEGDEIAVRIEDAAIGSKVLVLEGEVASVGQNGAGHLVGLSPMVVRIKATEVSLE